ncbi:hypothetical protein M0804_002131 [Polistes exclamans]|nr:hypothetical protein M0804_002131 [Polistes exclamans]
MLCCTFVTKNVIHLLLHVARGLEQLRVIEQEKERYTSNLGIRSEDKDWNRPELIRENMFAVTKVINQKTRKLQSIDSDLLNLIIVVAESKRTGYPRRSLTKIEETLTRVKKLSDCLPYHIILKNFSTGEQNETKE